MLDTDLIIWHLRGNERATKLLAANQKHYHFIPLLEMETFKVR